MKESIEQGSSRWSWLHHFREPWALWERHCRVFNRTAAPYGLYKLLVASPVVFLAASCSIC